MRGKSSDGEPSSAYRRSSLTEPYGKIIRTVKGLMGHHHETVDHRDPGQASGFSQTLFYRWQSCHRPQNSCTLFPVQAVPVYWKITGIVSILNGETTTSTFVFSQSLKQRICLLSCQSCACIHFLFLKILHGIPRKSILVNTSWSLSRPLTRILYREFPGSRDSARSRTRIFPAAGTCPPLLQSQSLQR